MFGGVVVVVVVVVVDSSSFVFKSPRQTSAWGPGKKRGRRFKRPRKKKTLPPSASSSPLPSRLKMRVAGQSPTHGQSEARRGVTAPACKRPAPAVRQWSGVAGVSRAAWPPPKDELDRGILGSQRPVLFCPCSCRRRKGRNWPPSIFLWSISIPRWPCRCRLSVPGSSRCREMPSPLRPLPLCLCLSTRQCEGRGQPGRPKSHSFPSAVGSVPSGEARLVAGAHISMAVLGTATRWTGGTEL